MCLSNASTQLLDSIPPGPDAMHKTRAIGASKLRKNVVG